MQLYGASLYRNSGLRSGRLSFAGIDLDKRKQEWKPYQGLPPKVAEFMTTPQLPALGDAAAPTGEDVLKAILANRIKDKPYPKASEQLTSKSDFLLKADYRDRSPLEQSLERAEALGLIESKTLPYDQVGGGYAGRVGGLGMFHPLVGGYIAIPSDPADHCPIDTQGTFISITELGLKALKITEDQSKALDLKA